MKPDRQDIYSNAVELFKQALDVFVDHYADLRQLMEVFGQAECNSCRAVGSVRYHDLKHAWDAHRRDLQLRRSSIRIYEMARGMRHSGWSDLLPFLLAWF